MLDLARGPLLVGVADRPAALVHYADPGPAPPLVDVVEARLDLFPAPTLEACAEACARLEAAGTPVLVTLRTAAQGGRFSGPEPERLALFREALAIASWADVEDDAGIVPDVASLVARRGGQLVVSHHDFARTPPLEELLRIVDGTRSIPGAIAKVATAVRTEDDRRTLFELLERRPDRTCVIGMEASEALRIELPARGSLLAYGYIEGPTAPGQLSAAETHARLLAASASYAERKHTSGPSRT
jgi:3-dehydroquinate dehydratase-1